MGSSEIPILSLGAGLQWPGYIRHHRPQPGDQRGEELHWDREHPGHHARHGPQCCQVGCFSKTLKYRTKVKKSKQTSFFQFCTLKTFLVYFYFKIMMMMSFNKHCEILVSCSDKGRNCMQAHVTECKVIELHASLCNWMQAYVTECKFIKLHASLCNCRQAYELHAGLCNCKQAYVTECKLKVMELHASSCKCIQAHVTAYKLM